MPTKYILHGGFASEPNQENDLFFREILKDAPENPNVLLVLFAKETHEAENSKTRAIAQFEKNKEARKPSYEVATTEDFIKQVAGADIVYLYGGNTLKLLNSLKQLPDLATAFGGKTIAGESAGAYTLATCFYSKTVGGVVSGLSLVPVKTICHYAGINQEKLDDCPAELETLLLPEYQYRVFYRN